MRAPHPPPDPAADDRRTELVQREYKRCELRNERVVGLLGVVLGACTVAVGLSVGWQQDPRLGQFLAGGGAIFGLYHAFVWRFARLLERHLGALRFFNVTFEVTAPALVTLVDADLIGSAYALTSTPPLVTFLAVAAAGLRLRRWLPAYAGALAAAQYLAVYAYASPGLPPELASLPSLSLPFAVMHAAFLLVAGVFAASATWLGRRTAHAIVAEVLERERVRTVFGEYISPQAVDKVLAGQLAYDGERRTVSVLFADIRGFTRTASSLEPEAVVAWLNDYFGRACDVIAAHGGMVNKFIGDGLLAVFGAPEPQADHALAAARAALELAAAAPQIRRPDGEPTRIGVGVHTGEVVLGSIGSPSRRDYTVIGDTVNVASRLEGLTRELGADVLVSEAVVRAAPGLRTEAVGPTQVKGRDEPVLVHRLVSAPAAAAMEPDPRPPEEQP